MLPCIQGGTHVKNRKIRQNHTHTSISDNIGHLPGDVRDKLSPWMTHMLDYCTSSKCIETMPLGFIRGSTWHNTWIIADEMQNSTPKQMKSLLTRVGEDSNIIITGDLSQSDIDQTNGFEDLLQRLNNDPTSHDFVKHIAFDIEDIMRSEFVKYVHTLYDIN